MVPIGLFIAGPLADRFGASFWFLVGGNCRHSNTREHSEISQDLSVSTNIMAPELIQFLESDSVDGIEFHHIPNSDRKS